MHHVDVHVSDFGRTQRLLAALMPHLGYSVRTLDDDYVAYWRNGVRPSIGFIADGEVSGSGMMRLAFAVAEKNTVDAAARAAIENGARNIEGPAIHDEYSDDYYAVFFEDTDGNRFEVVHDAAKGA